MTPSDPGQPMPADQGPVTPPVTPQPAPAIPPVALQPAPAAPVAPQPAPAAPAPPPPAAADPSPTGPSPAQRTGASSASSASSAPTPFASTNRTGGGFSWNNAVRLRSSRPLIVFGVGFVVVLLVLLAVILVFAPKPVNPRCPDPSQICPPGVPASGPGTGPVAAAAPISFPPPATSTSPLLHNGTAWTDPASGVSIDYDPSLWTPQTGTDPNVLMLGLGDILLRVEVEPSAQASADTMMSAMRGLASSALEGVIDNTDVKNKALRAQIGYIDAQSDYMTGSTTDGGQIVNYGVTVLAGTQGNSTIGVFLAISNPDSPLGGDPGGTRRIKAAGQIADIVMHHVYWTAPAP